MIVSSEVEFLVEKVKNFEEQDQTPFVEETLANVINSNSYKVLVAKTAAENLELQ